MRAVIGVGTPTVLTMMAETPLLQHRKPLGEPSVLSGRETRLLAIMPELPVAGQLDAAIWTMTAISVTMASLLELAVLSVMITIPGHTTHISATMARLGRIPGDVAVMSGTV